jgi:DnaJ-class molecular chaperone
MIPYPKLHRKDYPCPCCHGTGVQHNSVSGLTVICPCCGGNGNKKDRLKRRYVIT